MKKPEAPAGFPAYIRFTPKLVEQLRTQYKAAVANKQASFVFESREFVTGYAKYLLQYLDQVMGK